MGILHGMKLIIPASLLHRGLLQAVISLTQMDSSEYAYPIINCITHPKQIKWFNHISSDIWGPETKDFTIPLTQWHWYENHILRSDHSIPPMQTPLGHFRINTLIALLFCDATHSQTGPIRLYGMLFWRHCNQGFIAGKANLWACLRMPCHLSSSMHAVQLWTKEAHGKIRELPC